MANVEDFIGWNIRGEGEDIVVEDFFDFQCYHTDTTISITVVDSSYAWLTEDFCETCGCYPDWTFHIVHIFKKDGSKKTVLCSLNKLSCYDWDYTLWTGDEDTIPSEIASALEYFNLL